LKRWKAPQLEQISVCGPDTRNGSALAALAEEDYSGPVFDAASIARLFADHPKLARAVLSVSASSFAAACLHDAVHSNSRHLQPARG
jgi:hypothetical protein